MKKFINLSLSFKWLLLHNIKIHHIHIFRGFILADFGKSEGMVFRLKRLPFLPKFSQWKSLRVFLPNKNCVAV